MRFLWLMLLLPSVAFASGDQWKQVGKGEMHKLFWHVYDTTLTTPNGNYDPNKPYALENHYHMDFTAEELAERSIDEMRRHAAFSENKADAWRAALSKLWPDVKDGDRIRAVATPNKKVTFYHNGTHVGEVADASFVKPFMDIWLGENSSEPELRNALLRTE